MSVPFLRHAAAKLQIADILEAEPLTAEALAKKLGTNTDATFRVMRGLATTGMFRLRPDEKFENNRFSRTLLAHSPESVKDFVEYFGSKSNVDAWTNISETLKTGKNGFENVHKMPVWDWLKLNPNEGKIFVNAMVSVTSNNAHAIASAYPFRQLKRICDVAGGQGALLGEILVRHKFLKAILFDEKYVLDQAKIILSKSELLNRVSLTSGNFFETIPSGCDAYILKDILHDWDDERSLKILGNVRRAMQNGNKLLIVEMIVPTNNTTMPGPLVDLQMMMVCCGGRQRSVGDFKNLFSQSGFEFQKIYRTSTPFSILEATAAH